jgi:RHS repeat-associated protein
MQLQRIKLYYDPRGQVIRTVNPDGSEQRVIYGLPAQVSEPGSYAPSAWETYTYDANDLNPQSPHYGTPKSAVVDAMGRTVQTLDRLESSNSTEDNVQMLYEYDIRGNLLNVKDAYNREVFEHKYDLRPPAKEGETVPPLWTRHINKGESHVVFDCTGKPVESRDAKGALILSEYDVLQRPTKVWCRDNASEDMGLRQKLVYGTSSPNLNLVGRLMQKFDESGPMDMRLYDFKGNPLIKIQGVIANSEIQTAIDASDASGWMDMHCYRVDWDTNPTTSGYYRTDMAYDALNRVMKITYPADANNNRKELIPEYNRAGALKQVYFDGNQYVQNIGYNAKGQRLIIAYGNNLMTRYTYDDQTFRLARMRTERYTYSQDGNEELYAYEAGTVKQDFANSYDKVGNITNIHDATPGGGVFGLDGLLRSFGYDALYRLLSATGRENQPDALYWNDSYRSDDANTTTPYTQTYQYDLMGNMNELHKSGANSYTRTYNHNNNLLEDFEAGANTFYYEYDDCGNQIKENEERNFQWDYGDKLRLYYNQTAPGNEPSVYTHYLYDAAGYRVKKLTRTAGGNWETITYIDGIIEYRENDANEYQSITHIMDDTRRIATIREGDDFGDTTPAIKYNLDDHLGSSNVMVDENGTLVNREEYYPFGETSFGSYAKKRYRFCGKEKDEESGLYYYGARYYAPWLCRFVSVDPKAQKYVQQTPFAYADNNPINKMDYNGEGTGEGGGEQAKQGEGTAPPQTHQVKKGETLSGIAKQHGTTVDALRKANNLDPKNDTKLQIGTKLNIPQASGQSSANTNLKFNFDTILADNARSFMPTPLGLNTPKPGSSGGFSGRFMRTMMGNTPGELSGNDNPVNDRVYNPDGLQASLAGNILNYAGSINLTYLKGVGVGLNATGTSNYAGSSLISLSPVFSEINFTQYAPAQDRNFDMLKGEGYNSSVGIGPLSFGYGGAKNKEGFDVYNTISFGPSLPRKYGGKLNINATKNISGAIETNNTTKTFILIGF